MAAVSRPLVALFLLAVSAETHCNAQTPAERWQRAGARVGSFDGLVERFPRRVHWIDGGAALWFAVRIDGERRFVRVDCASGRTQTAADAAGIGVAAEAARLEPLPARTRSRNGGERVTMRFKNELDVDLVLLWVDGGGDTSEYGRIEAGGEAEQGTFDGHAWRLETGGGEPVAVFRAGPDGGLAVIDAAAREALRARPRRERRAPSGAAVRVRDGALWRGAGDAEVRLAASDADGFRGDVHPSPDGSAVLAFDETAAPQRQVTLVESSPREGLQPKTSTLAYRKPGDPLPTPRPRLLRLDDGREIAVDPAPFAEPWSLGRVHWAPDGGEVFVLYNRRGHQQLTVYGIDAATGKVRTVVDERSETFVDYSQKTWMQWLDDSGELLWMSERSGFNHLYLVDVASGEAQPITSGEWMVRAVERVDIEKRRIWFTALGVHSGQDPYHRHLARVDFDGANLTVLTEADGDHLWDFAPDGEHFVARWSRIDQPTVVELRRSSDGKLIRELGRDDPSRLVDAGFRFAERFVAKGRDGETDIHGFLITPSDFDPSRRYPVLESIYAGPHDFHVPKSFSLSSRDRRFAELGFVVVKIDGMGTNWRGKAFHDVCWQNLKDAGFPDRIAWMQAAAKDRPWMDLSRVGVFGGSAGGQNAMAALLWHGEFYKAAAADCGCHDNRMDKIWWNEAWMGWPVGDWYAASSNVEHADRLRGDLFLTVGELDRNVDPASTLQVVDALIRADKDFEFLLVPGGGHGVGESRYAARKRAEFFVRALRP